MIIPGTYLVNHVSLHASNVILKFEQGNTVPAQSKEDRFLRCPKLLVYQQPAAFDVKLYASKYMHLNRNRSLELELSSGWNDVQNGELQIRAATAGLRLQTSEAKVVTGSLDLHRKAEVGTIRFGAMSPGTELKIRVPFSLEYEVDEISLKLEISYTTNKGDFFFATAPRMSIVLPLGVNVQDVFKHKALFSRFTISSATMSPLRLLSSKLEGSDVFQAEVGISLERPVVIFPRQAASMLYKVTKSSSQPSTRHGSAKLTSALSLVLHYICLEEEIDNAVTHALQQNLSDTPLYSYIRLVVNSVLSELHRQMSSQDLEQTAVLNEVSTAPLTNVRWKDHFNGLGRTVEGNEDIPTLLADKIQSWQKENTGVQLLPISLDETTISNSRSIIIPVDVPSITVLHTADVKLFKKPSTGVVPTNQPIPATLNIKWTKIWNTDSPTDSPSSGPDDGIEFVYEITAPTDTWLIGGRRKGHFKIPSASQEQTRKSFTFPVILIPLREGFLSYPTLDIRPAPVVKVIRPGSSDGGAAQIHENIVTCETDYKNAGETIRVVSDARKTTVSLDASGPQGGAWLLESERR